MDIGTLNMYMNYYKAISGPVDLSSVISKVLCEENIPSAENQSTNEPKKPRKCSGKKHPASAAFKDDNRLTSVNDVDKTLYGTILTPTLPDVCLTTSVNFSTVNQSPPFVAYSEPCSIGANTKLDKKRIDVDSSVAEPTSILSLDICQNEIFSENGSKTEGCEELNSAKATVAQQFPKTTGNHSKELASNESPHASALNDEDTSSEQKTTTGNTDGSDTGKVNEIKEHTSALTVIEIGQTDAEECESIISSLLKASKYFEEMPKDMPAEKLREEQSLYLKKANVNQEMAQTMETKAAVLQVVLTYFEMKIVEIVKFAKQIPGFTELSLDDQAALVKESRTESALIGGMRMINLDSKVFSTKCGKHFTIDEMNSVFSKDFLEQKVSMSKKITNLCMSPEEEAILRAISITFTDRKILDSSLAVQNIQNKLISCLIHVIKKLGKYNVGIRLGQLFDILVNLRDITEVDLKQVKKLLLEVPAYTNRPVVQEFL